MQKNIKTFEDSLINGLGSVLNGFANRYELKDQKEQLLKQRAHELNLAQTKANADLYNEQEEREHQLKLQQEKNKATNKNTKKEPTPQEKADLEIARIYNEALAKKEDPNNIFANMLSAQIEVGKGSTDRKIRQLFIDTEKQGSHNISFEQAENMTKEELQTVLNTLEEMEKAGITMDQEYKNRIKMQLNKEPKKKTGLFGFFSK